jgi:hypothetical protein
MVSFTPQPLYPRDGAPPPVPVGWEAGFTPKPILTLWRRSLAFAGNRTPAIQPIARWCTFWAISAPVEFLVVILMVLEAVLWVCFTREISLWLLLSSMEKKLTWRRLRNKKEPFWLYIASYWVFIVQAYETSQYVVPRDGIFLGKWRSSFAGSSDGKINVQSFCVLNILYRYVYFILG